MPDSPAFRTTQITADLHKRVKRAAADHGLPVYQILQAAFDRYEATEPPAAPATTALPSPFDGLSDDDVFTIHNLIAILRDQPQGAIFRTLNRAIHDAVTEYRKTASPKLSTADYPKRGAVTQMYSEIQSTRPTQLTDLESIAMESLIRVLRSPVPGLPDAILSNLAQFDAFADLYQNAAADPNTAARPATRHEGGTRDVQRDVNTLNDRARAVGSGVDEAESALRGARDLRERERREKEKPPVAPRKRRQP